MVSSRPDRPRISFEVFPPKSEMAAQGLWDTVSRLAALGPDFISVTYGAGGSTRERSLAAVLGVRDRTGLDVAGHLTCVGASKADVIKVAKSYERLGCNRIVALRGDPPEGHGHFTPHPEGFADTVELIETLAASGSFEIWVGAYPEKHPEAQSTAHDIDWLKRKIDAGATGAITQFFFETEKFLHFRDACAAAGISAPIVPGILPIVDFDKMTRFAEKCATTVPDWMWRAFDNAETRQDERMLSIAIATEQCDELLSNGVDHLHLYTLNSAELSFAVCTALGIEPQAPSQIASCG
ncbi:MAG: methylenetetrahydrofolate reductase [NAD(P)H] [Pikeienuella sp.]